MLAALDEATRQSADPPDDIVLSVSSRQPLGRVGQPKIHIDSTFLSYALELRGPSHLCDVFGCHPRTVCRRALELGLASPGVPV